MSIPGWLRAKTFKRRGGVELLVASVILLPSLFYPLARDQGLFSYVGQVIVDGGAPYRDVYEQKGPATHYTFALIVALFGTTTVGVRVFFFLAALAGARLAAEIGDTLAGASARLTCAACYALAALQAHPLGPWMFGQAEDIILPLMLGAVLLLGRQRGICSGPRVIAASALMGLAFAYKPTTILPSVGIAAVSIGWAVVHIRAWQPISLRIVAAATAFLAPAALFSLYLRSVGAFDDLWMFVVQHNLHVYSKLHSGTVYDGWLVFATYFGGIGLLAACGTVVGLRQSPLLWTLLWALIISSLGMVVWQWKFFILYHWTVLAGGLSIVAGAALAKAFDWIAEIQPSRRWQLGLAVAAVACLAATADAAFYLQTLHRTASCLGGRQSIDEFRAPYRVGSSSAAATYEVANYVSQRTQANDTLLVWGYDVVVNYLSERRSPTRFAMNRVLQRTESGQVKTWRQEFLRDLTRNKPAYIVIADEFSATPFIGNPREHFEQFDDFQSLVEDKYEFETRIGNFDLYHVKPAPPTTTAGPS